MIYCVEDDNSIRELMTYTLHSVGFESTGFSCGEEFWKGMRQELPQLILLDIMLPGEDGISILKKLKSSPITEKIPVVMATAKGSEYDKVIGLDTGADDYLVKPFGMMEMVSRIKAVLRRSVPTEAKTILTLDDIVIDKSKHQVKVDGKEIILTLKEYDLLVLLMENLGQVFSRDQLLSNVWQSDAAVETRTVDVHIGTLRTKLGRGGNKIKTIRGIGYRMEKSNAE
ncbi:MAG: winged helix-turn-helix domain-containing protein [Lachnospiraceae bacterium]|nr:winged helix-turn-helix domain-containing protein [Lachnospiraceae bacterium]